MEQTETKVVDPLGDRMKANYEDRFRAKLLRRTYTVLRVDGKAFHTYTRGLERPFDAGFVEDMNATALYLCRNVMGAKLAYVQSDEISVLLTDFDRLTTQAWFDGNVQKMCSVGASMATRAFNEARFKRWFEAHGERERALGRAPVNAEAMSPKWAEFDARVFQLPDASEVGNYFLWRQQDASRNSLSSLAQSLYPHSALEGMRRDELHEMIHAKGQNWDALPAGLKRGRCVVRDVVDADTNDWGFVVVDDPPVFSQDWSYIQDLLPKQQ